MSLDYKRLLAEKFERRTEDHPVPELKSWFPDEDTEYVWPIQNLSGVEIGLSDEASETGPIIQKVLQALMARNEKDTVDKVYELMGSPEEKTEAIKKRMYHLHYGSVSIYGKNKDERCPMELVDKLCLDFPTVFLRITNAILLLTGQGSLPGKPKPSGKTKK